MATNGTFANQEQYKGSAEPQAAAPAAPTEPAADANNDLSKDEVGWYFVESYYTTLSKSPEKLHLFYGKRSQFVSGVEAEVANVSVGRQAIQERIKQLDFQDCKVRVSNVDSQASAEGIVIQVIGEVSSKIGEPKKFVQTFVLAQQPTGYFVLNDILRYIDDENEEAAEPPAEVSADRPNADVPAAAPTEPEPAATSETAEAEQSTELDTKVVGEKLEEATIAKDESGANDAVPAVEAAEPAQPEAPAADPEAAAEELAEEEIKQAEKPKEPVPTPDTKPATEVAAEPIMPPKPMTWASRAAAASGPRPVVPLPKTATPPAQNQTRAPAPAPAAAAAAAPAAASTTATTTPQAATTAAPAAETASKDNAGWQTAGSDSKRQKGPQSVAAAPSDKEGTLGYVKFVTDKVQDAELKKALEVHGELAYFDINRQKNCAFVEYKTHEGYQAALASNPHVVNGEQIIVEQRRPKSGAFGGAGFGNSGRGGSQRGRGPENRNPGQGNARGNFSGQNRGRGAPRGRGNAQATSSA